MNQTSVRRIVVVVVLAGLFVAAWAAEAIACPTCKNGLGNDPARAGLVQGYFWSILFMMSMPFLILTGLGAYFYWTIRTARRAGWGRDVEELIRAHSEALSKSECADENTALGELAWKETSPNSLEEDVVGV